MDADEPFNPEYYQHLLSSLTINSRALITELTTIAERHIDQSKEICDLIESRIKKCLPQYKLFSIYLIDSICKNVGNPYNLIFGAKLYKIFTETYLVVTDTPTRQNLINMFKTWANAKTTSGLDLFPPHVIQKIEQFIIKATSISQNNQQNALTNRLTPDMLLREGNYLLQYIIMLNNDIEKLNQDILDEETKKVIKDNNISRNNSISIINNISENIMLDPKSFEANVKTSHIELQNVRKQLDDQSFQQQQILKQFLNLKKEDQSDLQNARTNNQNVKIEINLKPNLKYFTNITEDITKNEELLAIIKSWGKPIISKSEQQVEDTDNGSSFNIPESTKDESAKDDTTTDEQPLSSSLGMNFGSFSFMNSFLGSPKNETTDINLPTSNNSDSYDPEMTFEDNDLSSRESNEAVVKPSSLKRQNSINAKRVVKKVRFEV